jgi:hypothetical protein
MSDDAEHVLLTLPRGERGEIRLARSRYEGRVFTKLQLWYPAEDGTLKPGRQVVTIRDHELADVIAALQRIAKRIGSAPREPREPRARRAGPRGGGAQPGTARSDEELAEVEAAF